MSKTGKNKTRTISIPKKINPQLQKRLRGLGVSFSTYSRWLIARDIEQAKAA